MTNKNEKLPYKYKKEYVKDRLEKWKVIFINTNKREPTKEEFACFHYGFDGGWKARKWQFLNWLGEKQDED